MDKLHGWRLRCLRKFRQSLLWAGMLLGLIYAGNSMAATITSAQSGNWNSGATWVGGAAPGATDRAVIANGHTVTVTANVTIVDVWVQAGGVLQGNGGGPWSFTCGKGGGEDFTVDGTLDFGQGKAVTLVLNKNSVWGGNGTWNLSRINYQNRTLDLTIFSTTGVTQLNFSGNATPITGTGSVVSLSTTVWNFTGSVAQTLPNAANVKYGSIRVSNSTTVTLGIALGANLLAGIAVQSGTLANGGFAIVGTAGNTFSVANGATFLLTGTSTMASGFTTKTFGTTLPTCSTVNYGGTAQTVSNESYGNLTLSGSGTKTMPAAAMTVACDFAMSGSADATTVNTIAVGRDFTLSGTARFTAGNALTVTRNMTLGAGTTFTAASYTHNVGGNFTNNGATFTANTSTINLNGSAAQTIGGTTVTTFNNLVIANTAAVVSAATSFNTNGTLTVNTNAVLSPAAAVIVGGTGTLTGTGTVQVTTLAAGGFTSQYTITNKTMTNLTVEYAGAGAQTVSVITYGSATGGGLKISNASGVSLTANTTVAGTLTLFSGVINASTFTLLTTGNCTTTVLRTSGWVAGKLQLTFPAGAPTCTYPVGDATVYRPIDQAFASVTVAGAMIGSVSQAAGDHANIATSGLDSSKDVNRYWTLANPAGGTIAYTTYSAMFTFVAGDVDGGAAPLNFEVEASLGGGAAWTTTTIGARNATSNQATGISVPNVANTYYDFAVGEKKATTPGGFDSYDTTTAPATALTGNLHTKIAGAAFTFDIAALNLAKTGLLTAFAGPVKVELLDSSDNSGVLDATTACRSTWTTVIQTLSNQTFNAAGDLAITSASGRHRVTPAVTENNAWKDVRVRVTYPVAGPTVTGCSTDRFAIRPNNLTIASVTDATWQTAGITRALNNSGVSGGNVHKAGQPFTISAAAYNAAGIPAITSNYAGSPTIGTLACTLPTPLCANGTLTPGAWSASMGTVTTTTASYSEAGAFNLTLEDRTFASVDSADGTAADCTASGYYVCPSAAVSVGRFVPDHFDVTVLTAPTFKTFDAADAACSAGVAPRRTFTYIGQPFGYLTAPRATIYARNAAGATTVNYQGTGAGGLWKVVASDITQTFSNNAVGPALNTTLIGTPSVTDNLNGTGTVAAAATDKLTYQRSTAAPIALFSANLSLTLSAQDATENAANQGIISSTTAALFNGGGTGIAFDSGNEFRYGRLKLSNAHGSELLNLPVPLQAQYWNGTGFVTNTSDNCTSITGGAAGNINLTNPLKNLDLTEMSKSHVSISGSFVAGVSNLKLTKPSGGDGKYDGSVDVAVDLTAEGKTFLQGAWTGATYNQDPTARATFGVYKGSDKFIYQRENY